jgi:glutaredoxin 2
VYNQIKDFLKALREGLLFDADKKLKQLAADLQKLEKRLKEVTGENTDFIEFLNKKNDNPDDQARVALIKELLGESAGSDKQLEGIRGEKDKIKALHEDLNGKLRGMFSNPASLKMTELENLIKQADGALTTVQTKLKELDNIHEDIEERKRRWGEFEDSDSEKNKLIDLF